MHWRDLRRTGLYQHIADSLRPWTRALISRGFRLRDGYVGALERLLKFIGILGMEGAQRAVEAVMAEAAYRMDHRELDFLIRRFPPRAIALYWALFLADNRAASARETSKAYWLDVVREPLEKAGNPAGLADSILKRSGRMAHIALTALPRLGGGGASCR